LSAPEPIVGAVLTGSLEIRCPPLSGRCHDIVMNDVALAIVVQRPVRPWAELAIDVGDAPTQLREGELGSLPIHTLPDTFLVLRLRESDGHARTLWRGGPRPDPDRQPRWHSETPPAIAPLYSPRVLIPETQATTPRCARIELDVVSAPWVEQWPDPHRDPAAWDRLIAALPDSRWSRIVRDVVVMPSSAAAIDAQAAVPDCAELEREPG